MARFVVEDSGFFRLLGFGYGHIFIEGYNFYFNPLHVYDLRQGRSLLRKLTEKKLMTSSQAKSVDQAMIKANLAENIDEILATIQDYRLPDRFTSGNNFQLCDLETNVKHGHLISERGKRLITMISTARQALGVCRDACYINSITPSDAIHIMQQVIDAGLLKDHEQEIHVLSEKSIVVVSVVPIFQEPTP